jgi:hypothetical protein
MSLSWALVRREQLRQLQPARTGSNVLVIDRLPLLAEQAPPSLILFMGSIPQAKKPKKLWVEFQMMWLLDYLVMDQ